VLDSELVVEDTAGFGDLAFDQIKIADMVVVNKTDLVSPRQLTDLTRRIEQIVPGARIWKTTHGRVPLELIFNETKSAAMESVHDRDTTTSGYEHEATPSEHPFSTWTFRSDDSWSFNALDRAVAGLPRDIYRAKGLVQLDLDTGDYGIFQLTGRRATLRLREPDDKEADPISTELVFIGTPGTVTDQNIAKVFEQALRDARSGDKPHIVTDLRAFQVIFG
jgi:G3E family GTPase